MEEDDEIKGDGNSYTTEFRQYDPRLGRWLSLDLIGSNFPWQSPYAAFDNKPIIMGDPSGLAPGGPGDGVNMLQLKEFAASASAWGKEQFGESVIISHNMTPGERYLAACRRIDKDPNMSAVAKHRERNRALTELFEATGQLKIAKINAIMGGMSIAIMSKLDAATYLNGLLSIFKKPDPAKIGAIAAIGKKQNVGVIRAAAIYKTLKAAGQVKNMDLQDASEMATSTAIDVGLVVAGGIVAEAATASEGSAVIESTEISETAEAIEEANSSFNLTRHGELTDGTYTVSKEAMKKHVVEGVQGKSMFYPTINVEETMLKAAEYADENGLWINNKAKVPVTNTNIGTLGNGSPTNVINIYRNSNGFIHGSPGSIR